jgi:DNA-binding NarL/FixJ family response regulator
MAEESVIRLYYIDDHHVTRSGLRTLFRASRDFIHVTAEAKSIQEALECASGADFDVILLDLWLSTGDPMRNFTLLRQAFPKHPVVIYTGERATYWQRKMYAAGAAGYIDKEAEKTEIRLILETVMKGERCFPNYRPENQFRKLFNSHRDTTYQLTEEELQILRYMADGLCSSEISGLLDKHVSTIDKALRRIRKKFGVSSNIELLKTVIRLDLV